MCNIKIKFYGKGQNVLLIFTGIGGTVNGFENKYVTIAEHAENYGFSAAVATAPSGSWLSLKHNFEYVTEQLRKQKAAVYCDIYAMGNSVGANLVLSYAHLNPQIKRVLAVNPVLNVNLDIVCRGIKNFTGERIAAVFSEQDSSAKWITALPNVDCLKTEIIPNTDHQFTDKLQTFIELPNKYLFYDYN